MTNKVISLFFILLFSISLGYGQEECFPKTRDGVFVYDQGDVLSPQEEQSLNNRLRAFTDSTSNVLVVVTVPDLCGTDKSQFAIEFGDQLGIGRADKDNGLVFLVKPKIGSQRGEVFIAVGTGLQGAITDAGTRRIVDYEVIPYFKQNNYYGGINAGAETLIRLASGEISEADYVESKGGGWVIFVFFLVVFILFILAQKYGDKGNDDWENYDRNGKHGSRRGSGIPWIFIGGGGGSRGGGGFGGGGFGGFGGGGFSGGGAGGSW